MERRQLAERVLASLALPSCYEAPVLVNAADPQQFLAQFAAACAGRGPVVLGSPSWGPAELSRVRTLLDSQAVDAERGWLWIPTGGSSGVLRFARHDQDTLWAAVQGFKTHFALERLNAVGLLPLYHVSGLMAWMRCVLIGGTYQQIEWKSCEAGEWPQLEDSDWVLSLVPTQVQRLLRHPDGAAFLRRFRTLFVGGGPAWLSLIEAARGEQLRLSLGYGMTETAAMVCAQRPEVFLAGAVDAGTVMPHARVQISAQGRICIESDSLMRGYAGEPELKGPLLTEDLGHFTAGQTLVVEGRQDALIITGGEKVSPIEVEEALRQAGLAGDFSVIGAPDPDWGAAVILCLPALPESGLRHHIEERLRGLLPAYKRPKQWVTVSPWPRNDQGKLNRLLLLRAVAELER